MFAVNYWAVLSSTVVFMVVGMLWYGPIFGKRWAAMVGLKMEEIDGSGAVRGMIISIIASFLGALTVAVVARMAAITGGAPGLLLGIGLSVGLIATSMASNYAYERRTSPLFLINSGYRVVCFGLSGLIIGLW